MKISKISINKDLFNLVYNGNTQVTNSIYIYEAKNEIIICSKYRRKAIKIILEDNDNYNVYKNLGIFIRNKYDELFTITSGLLIINFDNTDATLMVEILLFLISIVLSIAVLITKIT